MGHKPEDLVTLLAQPEEGVPEQRAHIVGVSSNGTYTACVIPEDREPDDEDGLVDVMDEFVRAGWLRKGDIRHAATIYTGSTIIRILRVGDTGYGVQLDEPDAPWPPDPEIWGTESGKTHATIGQALDHALAALGGDAKSAVVMVADKEE